MKTTWTGDGCTLEYMYPGDFEHARAVLKIHRACTPPCPRAVAAMRILQRLAGKE